VAAARIVEDPAPRAELLDVIERQALRLQGMVEEILASARMEREQSEAVEAPLLRKVDIAALVRLAALDAQLAGRPVTVDAPGTCEVRADPEGLRRVVGNLIENAHKYGSSPVTVTVAPDAEGHVVLSVIDRGPGIPVEERERIFERFYRTDPNGVQPGLGLGLSIVRGVVEQSGGHVWVEDAPGGGAAFRVALHAPADDWREAVDVH
jgi:signal transduction histidine kinase